MALSDLQIGYIRREIDEILNFVPGPAPRREVELVEWCRNACGADTVREVADEWARLVIRFGSTLFHSDLAEAVRRNRPTVLRSIIQDLDSIEDQTIAILCTAVDSAESEQIFGRIEAAQRIKPKGETDAERESRETLEEEQFAADNERAAELSGDEWEIPNFFENLIGGDEATFGRFRDHFRRIVETVLPQSRFEVREAEGNGDDGQAPNPSDPPSADPPAECDAEELTGRLEALIRDCTTFLGVDDLARFVASADPGWGNVDGLLGNADLIWRMADNLELPRPPAPPIGRGNRSVAADVVRHLASWAQARLSEVRAKAADALSEEQAKAGMTWQKVAERMNRLRTQGEPWTSHDEMAKRFDCSTGTTCKAVKNTPELQNWAKRQNGAAPRTQSIIDLVTDRTKQKRELNPRDEAAIREYLEQDDLPADARAFFHSLSTEDQLAFLDDPDDYRKILGRKS